MSAEATTDDRAKRKIRRGTVVSSKMNKSIVVRVDRTMRHPTYKRVYSTFSKLYAHDENNEAGVGDMVQVMETRPLSATKRWRLVAVLKKAK